MIIQQHWLQTEIKGKIHQGQSQRSTRISWEATRIMKFWFMFQKRRTKISLRRVMKLHQFKNMDRVLVAEWLNLWIRTKLIDILNQIPTAKSYLVVKILIIKICLIIRGNKLRPSHLMIWFKQMKSMSRFNPDLGVIFMRKRLLITKKFKNKMIFTNFKMNKSLHL